MVNKKIIINNVDVSRCECHNPNVKMDCSLYPLQPDACKNNPNCYYKLYKRKEQECEELKNKIEFMEEYIKTVENSRNEFEKESKFLKEENTEIRKYQYEQDFLQKQLDQLKQTLTEIKDFLEYEFYGENIWVKERILQKISEVENDR